MPNRVKQRRGDQSPAWAGRLQGRLEELGWSVAELARRMGRSDDRAFLDSLYKYVRGNVKQPRGDMLDEIAKAVGMPPVALVYGEDSVVVNGSNVHQLHKQISIRTVGEVAANIWRDISASDETNYDTESDKTFPPDPRFPAGAQYDLIVRGTSINKVAQPGDRLRVVDIAKTGIEPSDNDLVVVRRLRDGGQIIETTAKRLKYKGNTMELWPDSTDPRWQSPLPFGEQSPDGGEQVEIAGIVLYVYRPMKAM